TDSETLLKQLKAGRQDLAATRALQETLQQKVEDASNIQDQAKREQQLEQLRHEQQQVRESLEETLRRLQRLQSSSASSAGRAAERMNDAESNLATGNTADAQKAMQEALDDLEQAERELATDQKHAEEQLAREQLENLTDQLASLLARQKATIGETQRLQLEFEAAGKWSRARLKSLRDLIETQQNLRDETAAAADNLIAVEIIALSLRGAVQFMLETIEQLNERNTGSETVALQQRAVRRFEGLIEALAKDESSAESEHQSGQPSQKGQPSDPAGDIVTLIAQLKVIRGLQEDLTVRYKEIRHRSAPDSALTDDDQQELQSIAEEQDLIADLIRELTSSFGEPDVEADVGVQPAEPDAR
ncbi:MAG: hypothetical protein O3B86_18610, partial [Planctomycetota bacterium]|nr:hypothetical protein [Planctomycetota bacterium]